MELRSGSALGDEARYQPLLLDLLEVPVAAETVAENDHEMTDSFPGGATGGIQDASLPTRSAVLGERCMLEQGTAPLATIMSQALTREGGEAGRPLPASQGTLATRPGMARCRSENTGARYQMTAPVSIRPEVKKPEQSIEDFVRYFERVMRANR